MSSHQSRAANESEVLTPTDFARFLRIGLRTFHTWRSAGHLPVPDVQIRKTIRWRRETVEQWVSTGGRTKNAA